MCKPFIITSIQIGDRSIGVDKCIASLVQALNTAGVGTVASCCGHGKGLGNIALCDGRELIIAPDFESARRLDKLFKGRNLMTNLEQS